MPKNPRPLFSLSLAGLLILALLAASPVQADKDVQTIPALEGYPDVTLSPRLTQRVQRWTGVTTVSSAVGRHVLKRELKNAFHGRWRIHGQAYSASDLRQGRLRRLQVEGRNLRVHDALPVDHLRIASAPDTPILLNGTRRPVLLRPLRLQVDAEFSEASINAFLDSDAARPLIENIKIPLPPFGPQYLDALEPDVRFGDDGLVHVTGKANVHGAPPENALPVSFSGRIVPDRNRISLKDVQLTVEGVKKTDALAAFIEDFFAEIVNLERIKIKRHQLSVQVDDAQVTPGKRLRVHATVQLQPDKKTLAKLQAAQLKPVTP